MEKAGFFSILYALASKFSFPVLREGRVGYGDVFVVAACTTEMYCLREDIMRNQQNDLVVRIQDTCNVLAPFAFGLTRNTADRDDLLQETFLKAFNKRQSLHPKTDLKAWIYTIMRNTFISHYHRRAKRGVMKSIPPDGQLLTTQPMQLSVSNHALSNLMIEEVQHAMETLGKHYLAPLTMYARGFCYKEIAMGLCLPMGTVKNRIHIARRLLKEKLIHYQNLS